ncbi:MAG: SCO family protein [Deltaproteobacteria bacterium]|nr:SCO family protein [Deltaproteobacteria bacterium]MBV8452701.1 SCO family protein [Deltaproteobacteria bacterium]
MKRLVSNSKRRTKSARLNLLTLLLGIIFLTAAFPASIATSYASKVNYLPDITLTNQNSQPVSLSSLRGQPVLVGFVHTMCKGVCQMMTANMRSVASALPPAAAAAGVTMLLITTDPAEDHPPQLLQYAKNQDLAGKRWILVTGPEDSIKRVMRLYGVKHEETDDAMMHVMKLFLLAPGGVLARVYPGMKIAPTEVASEIETLTHRSSDAASEGLGAAHY